MNPTRDTLLNNTSNCCRRIVFCVMVFAFNLPPFCAEMETQIRTSVWALVEINTHPSRPGLIVSSALISSNLGCGLQQVFCVCVQWTALWWTWLRGIAQLRRANPSGMKFATRHKRGEVCNWCALELGFMRSTVCAEKTRPLWAKRVSDQSSALLVSAARRLNGYVFNSYFIEFALKFLIITPYSFTCCLMPVVCLSWKCFVHFETLGYKIRCESVQPYLSFFTHNGKERWL
jgi:hypothetical protein